MCLSKPSPSPDALPGETAQVPRAHLPPVGIVLVYNLKQVPSIEVQAGFLAGDKAVSGWVIVKVAFHKYLGQGFGKGSREEAGEGWRGRCPFLLPPLPRGWGGGSVTQFTFCPSPHKDERDPGTAHLKA